MDIRRMSSDEWWEKLNLLSEQQWYEFLKESFNQEIPAEMASENDLVDLMISVYEYLKTEKEYDKILDLQSILEDYNPNLLGQEKHYADSVAADIYIFKKDEDFVRKSMYSLINNPVKSIDTLLPMTKKLVYYGYGDFVQHISKKVFETVRNSDELIPGAEEDFAQVIFTMQLQSLYERSCEGLTVDKAEFVNNLKEYGFDDTGELKLEMETLLITNDDLRHLNYNDFIKGKKSFFRMVLFSFCKYAFKQKNMNFATAYDICFGAWENFGLDNSAYRERRLDSLFKLNKKGFHDYISDRLGFLSNQKPYAFAVLWGLPYVYDFLRFNLLIDENNHMEAIKYINHIKMELIEGQQDNLWEYAFVHHWHKPDSTSEEEFLREKELFERTFKEKIDIKQYLPDDYYNNKMKIEREMRDEDTFKRNGPKTGRNDPCPCGSGKKHKKCCGKN